MLAFLRQRQLLLVLDNLEHVLEAAVFLARVVAEAPQTQLLVTSRERLRLQAEWVVELRGLPVPSEEEAHDTVLAESLLLFLDRARHVARDFALGPHNWSAVAAICRRLEGLPLAIELAAARVTVLPPTALQARLDQAVALLTGGARDLPERHRTLRATLTWSCDLLDTDEQALFRRVAVFQGGWTLEFAEDLEARVGGVAETVLERLASLVDKSLVVVEGRPGQSPRYRLLEPIRQYARELLDASDDSAVACRQHAQLFLTLAEEAQPELRGARDREWLVRLDAEHDNLRAALAWALNADEPAIAARVGWSLLHFWWARSTFHEGRQWMEQVLAHQDPIPAATRLRALMTAEAMAYGEGDVASVEHYARRIQALAQDLGDEPLGEAYAALGFGLVAMRRGAYAETAQHCEDALPRLYAGGEHSVAAQTLTFLGTALLLQGDTAGARHRFADGLALAQQLGDRLGAANAQFNLGQLALTTNDFPSAAAHFAESMRLSLELADRANIAYCLEGLAAVAAAQNDGERAARLFGAAEGVIATIAGRDTTGRSRLTTNGAPDAGNELTNARGHTYYMPDLARYEQALVTARLQLGEEAFAQAWHDGRTLPLEHLVVYARGGTQ